MAARRVGTDNPLGAAASAPTAAAAAKKVIPAVPVDESVVEPDQRAAKEAAAFEQGDYEKQSKKSEHKRSETVKNVLHWVAVVVFLEFVLIYMILLGLWAYHLLAPAAYTYLDSAQFEKIQAIVLSGIVASALSKYYERYMK